MKILKYTKTYEDCPNNCKGFSYLHDNMEEKTCGICGTKWNRIENIVVSKDVTISIAKINKKGI